jgi:hypothetical protein
MGSPKASGFRRALRGIYPITKRIIGPQKELSAGRNADTPAKPGALWGAAPEHRRRAVLDGQGFHEARGFVGCLDALADFL